MVRRLVAPFQYPKLSPRITRRFSQQAPKLGVLHVMGTCVGRENPARSEPLDRPEIDLLVAAQGAFERALRFRKGRWIQHDQIPQRFTGAHGVIEPVEHVGYGKFSGDRIARGIPLRRGDRILRTVEPQHFRGSSPRRMQRERALVAKGVEHPAPMAVFRHCRVLRALIEIESGFLSVLQIEPVFHAIDRHPARLPHATGPRMHLTGHSF